MGLMKIKFDIREAFTFWKWLFIGLVVASATITLTMVIYHFVGVYAMPIMAAIWIVSLTLASSIKITKQ